MIIAIRGTDINDNKAAHMTAVLSAVGAIKFSRKTIIMQLSQGPDIEDILVGKRNAEVDIRDIGFIYEDTGMDALIMRAGSMRMQKEHFDVCCSSILDEDNMLDLAGSSKRDNFEDNLCDDEDKFELLLSQANDVYDDIYIYVTGKNERLLEMVNKHADVSIICVRQGFKENILAPHENSLYLVTSYDKDSVYSIRSLKKEYKAAKMYGIPYNCEFKDAYNDSNVLGYLAKNEKIADTDINYPFMDAVYTLLETYVEQKEEPIKEEDLPVSEEDEIIEEEELAEFDEPPVQVVEKKKNFGKKQKVVEELPESFEEETYEDQEEISEEVQEELIDEDISEIPEEESIEEYDDTDFEDIPDTTEEAVEEEIEAIPEPEPVKKSFKERREEKKARKMLKKAKAAEAIPEPEIQSEPSVEEWTCPKCGEVNPSKAKFCMECGTTKPVIPAEWTCPSCGEINPPKAKFCMECGTTKA